MSESNNYLMAIDILRCHLGLTEEEGEKELGLNQSLEAQQQSKISATFSAGYCADYMSKSIAGEKHYRLSASRG
ncbi:hypothetical protein P4S72_14590 [Vibrio sp. PP-XX7]